MEPERPLRPRHYPAIPQLVRRTRGDLTPEEMRARGHRAFLTQPMLDAAPVQPALVSTAEGAFRRLLLTIPSYAVEYEPIAAIYRSLLYALAPGVELVALTHQSVRDDVEGWLGERASVVVEAPDHLLFSIWAEDGYVVVSPGDQQGDQQAETYFVEPYAFPRYGDGLIAELVSNASDLKKTQAPLYFQGGNVLIGDDFFLIGADYPAESLQYVGDVLVPKPGESRLDLVHRLYREYLDTGRRLHYVGSTVPVPAERQRAITVNGERWTEILYAGNKPGTAQPLFHIDMFITPAGRTSGKGGRYRLLVGDPAMAAELLGEPVPPHAMREVFDSIATGLGRLGFEVIRNPLPLVYVDDPDRRERFWYFATANNALVETSPGGNHVYLPTFAHGPWESLAPVDRRNAEIWQDLGFTTHLLTDCHPLAVNLGVVHCIKKYLARRP